LALSHIRIQKGLKTFSSNWDEWNSILTDTEAPLTEIMRIMPDVEVAFKNLYDLSS
jgi:hypothetical protein